MRKTVCLGCNPELSQKELDDKYPWEMIPCKEHAPPKKTDRTQKYKTVLGDQVLITKYKASKHSSTAEGVLLGASTFYSPQEYLMRGLKEKLTHALAIQPVKQIDPASILDREPEKLSPLEIKRMKAVKYIKAYRFRNSFLNRLSYTLRKYALSEAQCDAVISTGMQFDEIDKNKNLD